MVLSTEALITDIPEPEKPMPAGGGPGAWGGLLNRLLMLKTRLRSNESETVFSKCE
jgi:hypothetical protein